MAQDKQAPEPVASAPESGAPGGFNTDLDPVRGEGQRGQTVLRTVYPYGSFDPSTDDLPVILDKGTYVTAEQAEAILAHPAAALA